MAKELFVLSDSLKVEPLERQNYEWEQDLQALIAHNPELISRNRSNENPMLYLVDREIGVYDKSEDQSESYSLDHLYVSADAVPVLVEVKRSSDTRIRREVVGQMLDYASHASLWNVDKLRSLALANNPGAEAAAILDADDFWDTVATNLKAERMRLVFVSDIIPDRLVPIIEFLDNHLDGIEVYGVSLTKYQSNGATMFAKSIVECPGPAPELSLQKRAWDYDSFLAQATQLGGISLYNAVKRIVDWGMNAFPHYKFGSGRKFGTLSFYATKSTSAYVLMIEPWGYEMRVDLYPQYTSRLTGTRVDEWEQGAANISQNAKVHPTSITISCAEFSDDDAFEKLKKYVLAVKDACAAAKMQ